MEGASVHTTKRAPRLEIGHQRLFRNASTTLTISSDLASPTNPNEHRPSISPSHSTSSISISLSSSQPTSLTTVPTTTTITFSTTTTTTTTASPSPASSSETTSLPSPGWTAANHHDQRAQAKQQQQQQLQQPPRRGSRSTPSSPKIRASGGGGGGTPTKKASASSTEWNIDLPPPGPPPVPPSPLTQDARADPVMAVPCESFSVLHAVFRHDMDKKIRHAAMAEDREAVANGAGAMSAERGCCASTERYVQKTRGEGHMRQLRRATFTSVKWLILEDVIPYDEAKWPEEVAKGRTKYTVAKASLLPAQMATVVDRETQQLKTEIREDVSRTRQGEDLFTREDVAEVMRRILFVYAKLYPNVGYIQGMNEILATIVYVLWNDAQEAEREFGGLFGMATLEADAFALFSNVMYAMRLLFTSEDIILTRCHAVQIMLAGKDPELEEALTEMDIQPELYMIRWIRILFSQLYPTKDLVEIWNTIFLFGMNSGIIENICVALLTMVRSSSK